MAAPSPATTSPKQWELPWVLASSSGPRTFWILKGWRCLGGLRVLCLVSHSGLDREAALASGWSWDGKPTCLAPLSTAPILPQVLSQSHDARCLCSRHQG